MAAGTPFGECLGNLFFRLWQQLAVYYLWKNLLELCDRNHTLGIFLEAKEVIRSWATSELGHTSYTCGYIYIYIWIHMVNDGKWLVVHPYLVDESPNHQ